MLSIFTHSYVTIHITNRVHCAAPELKVNCPFISLVVARVTIPYMFCFPSSSTPFHTCYPNTSYNPLGKGRLLHVALGRDVNALRGWHTIGPYEHFSDVTLRGRPYLGPCESLPEVLLRPVVRNVISYVWLERDVDATFLRPWQIMTCLKSPNKDVCSPSVDVLPNGKCTTVSN